LSNEDTKLEKRDRRTLRTRLIRALDDAENAASSDATSKHLSAVRLSTLRTLLNTERNRKLAQVRAEVRRLELEVSRLAEELSAVKSELTRVQSENVELKARPLSPTPRPSIDETLQRVEDEFWGESESLVSN
jgi:hypothetical protein